MKELNEESRRWLEEQQNSLFIVEYQVRIHGRNQVIYRKHHMTLGTRHTIQKCILQLVNIVRTDC
jgi:hypothetical protein